MTATASPGNRAPEGTVKERSKGRAPGAFKGRGGGRVHATVRFAAGPVGFALRLRVLLTCVLLLALAFAALIASLAMGDYELPWSDVVTGLFNAGPEDAELVVHELRLPRALVAIMVGFALGLAGAVFQAVTRNPLAGPDIVGITAGAGAGAVVAILAGGVGTGVSATYGPVPLGALVGAVTTGLVVYFLAFRQGTITGYGFVLVGIAANGMLVAFTRWALARVDIDAATRATAWLTGSLENRDYTQVRWMALGLLLLVPPLVALVRPYRMLQFGDDIATGLGVPTRAARTALLLVGTCLAALATACAGPVVFVALAAPQIARGLAGTAEIPLFTAGFAGAVVVGGADLLARTAFPETVPVGIVTGLIGAPYLLWFLGRANKVGRGG
ncbi:FecCD family ABC transporter permease [Streptodolium elevatio]|uniref:Iron chelate uptake ABC transporter family permease subunit n=1 Tax=Streptodolium elevatio TaxID=3157996 RepID=A0ABV3DPY7_9ACTN